MRIVSNQSPIRKFKTKKYPWSNISSPRYRRKSDDHDDDPTHEKRKETKTSKVQPGPKCGTTALVSGSAVGLSERDEESDDW